MGSGESIECPPRQWDTGIGTGGAATVDHFTGHLWPQLVDGPTEDGDRHEWFAPHGVDIRDGIGGGDASELKGVIDDRHEKVGSADHRAAVIQVVGRGIVT